MGGGAERQELKDASDVAHHLFRQATEREEGEGEGLPGGMRRGGGGETRVI